jgi:hypothetical protein
VSGRGGVQRGLLKSLPILALIPGPCIGQCQADSTQNGKNEDIPRVWIAVALAYSDTGKTRGLILRVFHEVPCTPTCNLGDAMLV